MLSVIVSTYDQPDYLRLCLVGFAHQELEDFEVVVADDGSDQRTAAVITEARATLGLQIQHLWQRDQGFRKCRILNKAIVAARGDYLVFTDGDCIPRRDFLGVHQRARRPGCFLSGGYVKLDPGTSAAIDEAAIVSGQAFSHRWLVRHGHPWGANLRKLAARGTTARLLNRLSRTRAGWHGHNASCWTADALAVNGFDETMGWGGEDREFGYRLRNLGLEAIRVRYSAVCIHLHHDRPWKDAGTLARNDRHRSQTLRSGRIRTPHGISQLVADSQFGRVPGAAVDRVMGERTG